MKRCPTCHRVYADETLSFCLEDGALLLGEGDGPATISDPNATIPASSPSHRSSFPTEVLGAGTAESETSQRSQPTLAEEPRITARDVYGATPKAPPPTAHNTTLVVGLTVIATLILIALGGVGAWFLFKGDKSTGPTQTQLNQNQNQGPQPPIVNNNLNNASTPDANTSPTTTASPISAPVDVAAVREQVTAVLNGWTSASRAHDLDKHMNYYADTLDTYYNASNVNASRVRADRARAYALYATLDIELSNLKVTADPAGDTATAVFDKTWTFEGGEKYSSGSVHQKIWLAKIGGRWRITGEKDLQVYYVNRAR
jgi:ketosteroid isomerase-like protein